MKISAVLIDIDNTLLDFDRSAEIAIINVAKKHSVELPPEHYDVFLKVNEYLWQGLERGELTKQDIYKRRWKEIFSELGIVADYDAFEEDFRITLRTTAVMVPGAKELMEYLSGKYSVYAASNASRLQQETRLKSTGLYEHLSGMFASEEIGFGKPSKEFFHTCCAELYPIPPSEIIMIGDNINADIIGAKNFGLKSIWFNYYGKTYDNYGFTDFYVNNLMEITEII